MLGFIKKIFSSKDSEKKNSLAIELSKDEVEQKQKLMKKIALEELEKIDFFNRTQNDVILKHLLGNGNLFKNEDYLTVDEKKALGINARLKISRSLVKIFDKSKVDDGFFKDKNPKKILSNLAYQVEFKATKIQNIKKYKSAGIKKIELLRAGQSKDCDWCKKQNGKIMDIDKDIIKFIYDNCKCDYNRIAVVARMD